MRDVDKEARVEARYQRIGEFIDCLGSGPGTGELEAAELLAVKIRMPTVEDPGTLLVIRASSEGVPFVAFVGAYQVGDAVLAWRERSKKGRMKWREDEPWQHR